MIPFPVPTLAEIAAHPDRVADLPGQVAAAYAAVFAGLHTSCLLRAVRGDQGMMPPSLGAVGLEEAAAMLGVSAETLRSRAARPPYVALRAQNGTRRRPMFSVARMHAFLEGSLMLGSGGSATVPPVRRKGQAGRPASHRPGLRTVEREVRP